MLMRNQGIDRGEQPAVDGENKRMGNDFRCLHECAHTTGRKPKMLTHFSSALMNAVIAAFQFSKSKNISCKSCIRFDSAKNKILPYTHILKGVSKRCVLHATYDPFPHQALHLLLILHWDVCWDPVWAVTTENGFQWDLNKFDIWLVFIWQNIRQERALAIKKSRSENRMKRKN